jgi:hypothetical protein
MVVAVQVVIKLALQLLMPIPFIQLLSVLVELEMLPILRLVEVEHHLYFGLQTLRVAVAVRLVVLELELMEALEAVVLVAQALAMLAVLEILHLQAQAKEVMAAGGLRHQMVAAVAVAEQAQLGALQRIQAAAEQAEQAAPRLSLAQAPTMQGAVAAVRQRPQPLLAAQVAVAMVHSLTTSRQWLARLTRVAVAVAVISHPLIRARQAAQA